MVYEFPSILEVLSSMLRALNLTLILLESQWDGTLRHQSDYFIGLS